MNEILLLASIGLLASMSPGPDMILVIKNSLLHGKKAGNLTATGVGLGMLIHVSYSLVGVAFIISQSIVLFGIIKYIGAIYLIYLGITLVREKKSSKSIILEISSSSKASDSTYLNLQYLKEGFLCNALNPKATLFILSLFTQIIDIGSSRHYKLLVGLMMALITTTRFIILNSIISHKYIREKATTIQYWLGKVFGGILLLLGLSISLK